MLWKFPHQKPPPEQFHIFLCARAFHLIILPNCGHQMALAILDFRTGLPSKFDYNNIVVY